MAKNTDTKPFILRCDQCLSPDPQARTRHQLQLLKNYNLDVLRDHLVAQYVTERESGKRRQDAVDAIMTWASNLVQHYSGMVHPDTGAPMRWWEARQWLMKNRDAAALGSFRQAPEKYRQREEAAGNLARTIHTVMADVPVSTSPLDDDPLA